MFFSLDGVDGSGKSTQIGLFCSWLREAGREVVTCRDPGSSPLGEHIRDVLLNRHDLAMARRSEMLLYMAARAQLVDEVIRPALSRGAVVVSDRFLLANVVYQAHAGGLSPEEVWQVGRVATDGIQPDLTFVLDLEVAAANQRLDQQNRHRDRIESRGPDFLARVRQGYLKEAARDREHILVVDASQSAAEIQAAIRRAAEERLARSSRAENR